MTKKSIRWIACILAICLMLALPVTASAASSFPNSLYLTQSSGGKCTLCSATMMIRARMYLSNNDHWNKVTENSVRSYAWVSGSGLGWNWTYKIEGCSIKVARKGVSGISADALKDILDKHPEGIALYVASVPHAVFLTDYEGDTFYCADPSSYYSGKRIPLEESWTGRKAGNQASILKKVSSYWYVSSYNIPEYDAEADLCECTEELAGEYICTAETELNIKSSHSSSANVIGTIPTGATVNVTKADDLWAHVEYNSMVGYVYVGYLKSTSIEEEEEEVEEPVHLKGDFNDDYRVSNSDVVIMSRYNLDLYDENSDFAINVRTYGDMNDDNRISNSDLLFMTRSVLGLI